MKVQVVLRKREYPEEDVVLMLFNFKGAFDINDQYNFFSSLDSADQVLQLEKKKIKKSNSSRVKLQQRTRNNVSLLLMT